MYQVIGTDGQIYGPANTDTLKLWCSQGKLTPQTVVIDPISGYSGPAVVLLRDLDIFAPSSPPVVELPKGADDGMGVSRSLVEADLFSRFLGLFIDALISIPLDVAGSIPVVGIVAAPLLCFYWLSRDSFFSGQSIGKKITRSRVVGTDGSPIGWGRSVVRNMVYMPLILLTLPGIGEAGWAVMGILAIGDIISVLATRRRLGDYLANTRVVKEASPHLSAFR